ncbi:calcineurin-like phosphoesterase [Daldinia caldariorum]|uniref:calcineurin-like phosphoesterase n=1 Tax=Daldinia caldariorum TaxID=326644 RepID=UPI0020089E16|nr:calcineurin-like phosphoesterase [Daldinia caldariorum]KAI1463141.1 calcineurin-like phosphoesterase [Daldinia caldariorum]
MTTIQILSDLHLEAYDTYADFEIPPRSPYLALLGDIGCVKKDEGKYLSFLSRQLANFRVVFLILGNHEPYYSTWDYSKQTMVQFEQQVRQERENHASIGEFILLDKKRYDIDSYGTSLTVLGCTLFSGVPSESMHDVSFGLNDFYRIGDWTVEQHTAEHERDLEWLNSQVKELKDSGRKVVVFTHHSPTRDDRAVEAQHRRSKRIAGFSTDLSDQYCWRSNDVILWAFGHTHYNCDYIDTQTSKRVCTNQKGYSGACEGFDVNRVISL